MNECRMGGWDLWVESKRKEKKRERRVASKEQRDEVSHNALFYESQLLCTLLSNMKFRPCIDLHSGQVKQIVGSTLKDTPGSKKEDLATNFETDRPAGMCREDA